MRPAPRRALLLLLPLLPPCSSSGNWSSNPVARHVACAARANMPTVCRLEGYDEYDQEMAYSILTLPEVGLLYEVPPGAPGSARAPDPIAPHQLPFPVADPLRRVAYVPPTDAWPPEGYWASFTYAVTAPVPPRLVPKNAPQPPDLVSELGLVVLASPEGALATAGPGAEGAGGWGISGNAPAGNASTGPKHHAHAWGELDGYVYGAEELRFLGDGGSDVAKWYFEAPAGVFQRPELTTAYGGVLRFTVRALYGDFSELNEPLDWVTLECAACNSGHGLRLVRFAEGPRSWDGSERRVELSLHPNEHWRRDPQNSLMEFTYASECEIAAVLSNLSRLAILGDFTRGAEAVAIDDVAIYANTSVQPIHPVACQRGCFCRYDPGALHPSCC